MRSAKGLKGIKAKKITWQKDEAKIVRIPEQFKITPATREVIEATYDKFGDVVREEHEIVTPEKTVKVFDAFYMDAYEVTVGQFKKFLKSSGYKPDKSIDWAKLYNKYSSADKHPMVLSLGTKQLPIVNGLVRDLLFIETSGNILHATA